MFFYNEENSETSGITPPSGPSLVSDNLVLHLDAGDSASYSGTGTTWYDLSGNGNNLSVDPAQTTSPIFQTTNGGMFSFDGVNDVIDAGNIMPGGDFSISFWYNTDYSIGENSALFGVGTNGQNNTLLFYTNTNYGTAYSQIRVYGLGSELMKGSSIDNTGWRFVSFIRQGSTYKIYLEQTLDNSATRSGSTSSLLHIGNFNGISRSLKGDLAFVSLYSKALSGAELSQNFDATKDRFGL